MSLEKMEHGNIWQEEEDFQGQLEVVFWIEIEYENTYSCC